jgi:hypothetical protein
VKLDERTYIMEMSMYNFLSKFFNISKYDFLVQGAYAPGSRIEFRT